VAEAVCPKCPPRLPKDVARHWKTKKQQKKQTQMDSNTASQLAGNPRPGLLLIRAGVAPQASLEML